MIVTVTMNPAIDKTIDVGSLQVGKLNRISRVELDAGGKGINVSKTIKALGGTSIATGFIGGNAGKIITNVLEDLDITTDFVMVNGETRTNTKVFEENGNLTELNEPGFIIGEKELEELLTKLENYAKEDTLFILAGSIPCGVPKDIYGKITELVHEKGAKVLMDADGELFRNALSAIPDMIKPNKDELAEYASIQGNATEEEVLEVAKSFLNTGIGTIAISMGGNGAMMMQGKRIVRCPVLSVKAHSTVGAGDAMVAAMAYAWDQDLPFEEMVKLSMATSAGAVTTIGTKPPTRELVEELKKQVVMIY